MLPAVFDEAVVDRFLVTQRGQHTAHGKRAALRLGTHLGRNRRQRRRIWQVVIADDTHHFFNQVFFDLDVKAISGWRYRDHAIRLRQRQTEALQYIHALRLGHWHTNHLGSAGHAEADWSRLGHIGLQIVDSAARRFRRSTNLQNQLGDALNVFDRQARVHTAFKAVARISRKVVAARTACDGLGPPERGFDVDMLGIVRHGSSVAAHDAGQRFDLYVIGNHANLVVHRDGVAIQQFELFTRLAPAHVQRATDLVQIEDMAWAAQLEHHVVGNVHQRRHTALAATGQTVHHPLRCLGLGVDVAHHAAREAATQVGRADLDRHFVLIRHGNWRNGRRQ